MKLDNEEMAVRELEQKAIDLVDHSKKRTKYYISSSGSANQDGMVMFYVWFVFNNDIYVYIFKTVYELLLFFTEIASKQEKPPAQVSTQSEKSTPPKTTSEESIPTNLSTNDLEEGTAGERESSNTQSK